LMENTQRQLKDNEEHLRTLLLTQDALEEQIKSTSEDCDGLEQQVDVSSLAAKTQPLNEDIFTDIQEIIGQQLDEKHPIRLAVQFVMDLYRSTPEYMAINTGPAKQKFKKELSMTMQKIETQRASPKKSTTLAYQAWSDVNAIQFLINSYIETLNQCPSKQNAEERAILNALKDKLTPIVNILKYDKNRHGELPSFFEDLSQTVTSLGDHPMKEAVDAYISMLKQTNDYIESDPNSSGLQT